MKNGRKSSGFTIVESLIFLAVTSALLISGMLLVGGQERKARFRQSLNDIREQIDGVINNVATGHYTSSETFFCVAGSTGQPSIFTFASLGRGRNSGCIYIGRAMQFRVDATDNRFNIYTLAGRQYKPNSNDSVTELGLPNGTLPKVIDDPGGAEESIEEKLLGAGIRPFSMQFNGSSIDTSTFAIMTDFASEQGGNLTSSSRSAALYAINGISLTSPSNNRTGAITALNSLSPLNYVAASDVIICFESTGTNQMGIVIIGKDSGQLTTDIEITNRTPTPTKCT